LCSRGFREISVLDHGAQRIELARAKQTGGVDTFATGRAGVGKGVAQLVHGAVDPGEANVTGGSERHTTAAPDKQRSAELRLQAGDRLRHRGLGHVHRTSRGAQAAEPGDLLETMQMPQVGSHGRILAHHSHLLMGHAVFRLPAMAGRAENCGPLQGVS
jgi:hypothetical protein